MKKLLRTMSLKAKHTGPSTRESSKRSQAQADGRPLLQPAVGMSAVDQHNVASRDSGSVISASAISSGLERLQLSSSGRDNQRPLLSAARSARHSRRSLSSAASIDAPGTALDAAALSHMLIEKQIKNVIVMAGAGISTPSGIPDFRTPGTGLYDNLRQYNLPFPEAVFDIEYFAMRPKAFFTLAKELLPDGGRFRPNYVHYFLRVLHEKGILLRVYTQNIDGLERMAGIPASKLVEAHGTFATATCTSCGFHQKGDLVKADIMLNKIPRCPVARCKGIVKPDIVFFGENLPRRFYLHAKDFPLADLVIVMGTSLETIDHAASSAGAEKAEHGRSAVILNLGYGLVFGLHAQVEPFAGILQHAKRDVPRLLINRELVGPFKSKSGTGSFDVTLIGDLVENVHGFSKLLGWDKDISQLMNELELKDKPVRGAEAAAATGNGCTSTTAAADVELAMATEARPRQFAAHPPSCTCQMGAAKSATVPSSMLTVHSASAEADAKATPNRAAAADGGSIPPSAAAAIEGRARAPPAGLGTAPVSARKFWMDSVASFKMPQPGIEAAAAAPAAMPQCRSAVVSQAPALREAVDATGAAGRGDCER